MAVGMINSENTVCVWRLMHALPLTFVIGVSFLLGASTVGWLPLLSSHRHLLTSAAPKREVIPVVGA